MTVLEQQLEVKSATPVLLEPFVYQYQMSDTACCPESILNSNRSVRWVESLTAGRTTPNLLDRDSDQLSFSGEHPPVEHEPILAFTQECLDHYLEEHKQAGMVPKFAMPEGHTILRYKPGQAYHAPHSDWGWPEYTHRHLTFSMFLNTCPEGGELEFVGSGLKVSPVEGRAVIFPAGWTHSHRGLPATVDRYVFNIFFGFLTQP